jgi:hypothetical protein
VDVKLEIFVIVIEICRFDWNMIMKTSPFYKLIDFDEFSATPKYQQLANSILLAIENRKLQLDDVLPSIDELSSAFAVSEYSGEKAINI